MSIKIAPLLALVLLATPALAEPPPPPSTIAVTGLGEASVAPNLARLSSGVVTNETTARDALAANSKAMAEVIAAFKNNGIEAKDIGTSNFTVEPQIVYPDNSNQGQKPRIVGYEVRNTVNVTVRDLNKLRAILDTAVTEGSNSIGSVSFDVDDASKLSDQARRDAFADAKRKAELYAESAGMRLGRVIELREGEASSPAPVMARMKAQAFAASAPAPIEQGQLQLSTTVNVVWELTPGR